MSMFSNGKKIREATGTGRTGVRAVQALAQDASAPYPTFQAETT